MSLPAFDASVAMLCALVVVAGGLAAAAWVYGDAKEQSANGNPISFSTGNLQIKTPLGWSVACALMFEFFIPIYLDNRRAA